MKVIDVAVINEDRQDVFECILRNGIHSFKDCPVCSRPLTKKEVEVKRWKW